MTYRQQEISRIKKRYERVDRHIRDNLEQIPPEQLALLVAKQQRRASMIAWLMSAEIRVWQELADGNYGRLILAEQSRRTLKERIARARAEGRPMVECFTVERIVE